MRRIYLTLILTAGIAVFAYDQLHRSEPLQVSLISPQAVREPARPTDIAELQVAPNLWDEEGDAMLPPLDALDNLASLSLVGKETLQTITQMLKEVDHDLRSHRYGAPETMPYTIVFLFHQSLAAYLRFLQDPTEGPDFHILFHRSFSGRYQYHAGQILMGGPTLDNGEGRFITTMFHEYQHYLFHSIYGTPSNSDIVWKYYNELAAHMFEELFAAYLPAHYFERAHRGGLPHVIRQHLEKNRGYRAVALISNLMLPTQSDRSPFYKFLLPVTAGFISRSELIYAIDESFHPDTQLARELSDAALQYWQKQP